MSETELASDAAVAKDSYDEVPYPGGAFRPTHPCHLAMVATLCGLSPPSPKNCRVLELGCSMGANLLPMAQDLPNSKIVGIDLSLNQIEAGRETVAELQLSNIELRHASILDVDESYGEFDYILCHGVYSWVPPDVQRKILDIGHKNLSRNGVLYVSYNTYPGWHLRGLIRDMMRYHVADFDTPQRKVNQARGLLDFLVKYANSRSQAYPTLLKEEAEFIEKSLDSYIYHEHLESINEPVYFHEFVRRVNDAGLRYLADASVSTMVAQMFDQSAAEILREAPLLRREQYMDFLRSRPFRSSLLCHPDLDPDYRLPSANLLKLDIALRRPLVGTRSPNGETVWQTADNKLTTSGSVTTVVERMNRRYPASVPVKELLKDVTDKSARQLALDALLMGFVQGPFHLSAESVPFCTEITNKPRCTPLARLQARKGTRITNLRHEDFISMPQQRFLIERMDGTRTVEELANELRSALVSGRFQVSKDGQPVRPGPEEMMKIVQQELTLFRVLPMLAG